MLENFLCSDSDIDFYNSVKNIYDNTSREVLGNLFLAVGLPISMTVIQVTAQFLLRTPQPEMNIKIERKDIDSRISEKICSIFYSVLRSAKNGLSSGMVMLKVGLLVSSVTAVVIPFICSMSRDSICQIYPMLSNTFQWLPSKNNSGLLNKILMASGGGFVIGTVVDYLTQFQMHSISKEKPIFNDKLNQVVDHLVEGNRAAYFSKKRMPSLLLSGPPGTGKTSLARWIAHKSNMDYIAITGSDITQYINSSMHVTKLNQLFQNIKNAGSPAILFIDEAESLLKSRDVSSDIHYTELLHAFLKQMEGENNSFMLVLATNRLEDIDSAVLDRMDFKLAIPLPSYDERFAMLGSLIPEHLNKEQQSFFSESIKAMVAKATEGFSGRRLQKMFYFLSNIRFETADDLQSIIAGYGG